MTESKPMYAAVMRACHRSNALTDLTPAQNLKSKCRMSVMEAQADHRHRLANQSQANSAVNNLGDTGEPHAPVSEITGRSICFNPEAKEFVPLNAPRADADSTCSRSPVAILFESQVAALTGNPEDGPAQHEPLLLEGPTTHPMGRSSAQVASTGIRASITDAIMDPLDELCPYAMEGECRFGDKCVLLHGLKCEYCDKRCLHPTNQAQCSRHKKECIEQHQINMEHSFAIARSADKTCGICLDVIAEKSEESERRFGILPSCNHCFCLKCVRKWRRQSQFENKVIRGCPQCRVSSDFVCPSRFWVETKEDKDKLISSYKQALRQKECLHYKNGEGICPFGNKCFYKHTTRAGVPVDVGPPHCLYDQNGRRLASTGASISRYLRDFERYWSNAVDAALLAGADSNMDSEVVTANGDVLLDFM